MREWNMLHRIDCRAFSFLAFSVAVSERRLQAFHKNRLSPVLSLQDDSPGRPVVIKTSSIHIYMLLANSEDHLHACDRQYISQRHSVCSLLSLARLSYCGVLVQVLVSRCLQIKHWSPPVGD